MKKLDLKTTLRCVSLLADLGIDKYDIYNFAHGCLNGLPSTDHLEKHVYKMSDNYEDGTDTVEEFIYDNYNEKSELHKIMWVVANLYDDDKSKLIPYDRICDYTCRFITYNDFKNIDLGPFESFSEFKETMEKDDIDFLPYDEYDEETFNKEKENQKKNSIFFKGGVVLIEDD